MRVVLDVFSGCPNPSWESSEEEIVHATRHRHGRGTRGVPPRLQGIFASRPVKRISVYPTKSTSVAGL